MERQHQGMDRPRHRQVPEGSGKHGKMEETGWEVICGAQTILAVKEQMMTIMMMMMMMMMMIGYNRPRSIRHQRLESKSMSLATLFFAKPMPTSKDCSVGLKWVNTYLKAE